MKYLVTISTALVLSASVVVHAEAPTLKSGTPVIYLADNLDEKDQLGWCIDTRGRGFAEKLQAHSCKPARDGGNDTQFSYHSGSGQIRSVPFKGKCMTLKEPDDKESPFHLLDCKDNEPSQQFVYDAKSMEIQVANDTSKCVIAGAGSRSAGPFMSRDLVFADCISADNSLKQWVVAEKRVEVMLTDKLDEDRGYCLDIAGGKGKNAPLDRGLQAHTCYHYTGSILEDQGFDAAQIEDGQFRITYFDRCMSVPSSTAGAAITLGECDNGELQKFTLTPQGQLITQANPELCVTVDGTRKREGRGGSPVHVMRPLSLQPCADANKTYQTWSLNSL
ncbi:MAG: ricin-type beta-trefoil lectin domain protein [Thiolinea sp.]